MKGYLYVLSNENYEGWLKLGITKNMTKRLRTYQTGDPFRGYKVEFVLEHPDYINAEKRLVDILKMFALDRKKEWYKISLHMLISTMEGELEDYLHPENNPINIHTKRV